MWTGGPCAEDGRWEMEDGEQAEWDAPVVAGDRGGEIFRGELGEAVLEHAPEGAGVGEGRRDFVCEIALGFQAEVGGLLAGHVGGDDLVEQLRAEQAAFNSD